jgi:hypothetical protein
LGTNFLHKVLVACRYGYRQALDALWWKSQAARANLKRLAALRGAYAGRRCFVMGNGPSLMRTDVRRLRDEVTIGSNALFLIADFMGYRPTFHTVEDVLVAEDRAGELNAMRGTTKIFPRDLAYCLKQDESTLYINFRRNYAGFPKFSDRFEHECYWGGTVSMLNLQLAYYLGCNPIYMIGFDHDYKVPPNLKSHIIHSDADDVNHIHPDYFGKGYRWHDPMVERMERSYIVARGFLDARGVRIYNATAGGRLEVFERVSYDEIVRATG